MRSVKKINTSGIKASDIKDSDIPLLDRINKQKILNENREISDKEREQDIQDEQLRIDNDIKGCYITFNTMFYGLLILMFIPVTFVFRDFTLTEILNFYGMYAVFCRNIVLIPLGIMFWMWQTAKQKDIYHPSTIKMRKKFKWIFVVTIILVVVSLIVFSSSLKDIIF